jgi:chemotaxis protein methyltransferase CheR
MPPRQQAAAAAIAGEEAPAVAIDSAREFAFSEADFRHLAQVAYDYAGIALAASKQNLVYSRLSRRLRALGMTSFQQYRDYLAESEREIESFINSISTNHTKFFRESHHFDHFRTHVAVPFTQSVRAGDRRLRVWSAGCSSGEEPYTIAVVLKREIRDIERQDVRILATDIDTDVLAKAARGEYQISSTDDIPKTYQSYFEPVDSGDEESTTVAVCDDVRSLIAFRRLNLMEPWPFRGLFDAIFCRNVMIYFDAATRAALVERFTQQLKPGCWLYIGHSESLIGSHPGLELVGRTVYRRIA